MENLDRDIKHIDSHIRAMEESCPGRIYLVMWSQKVAEDEPPRRIPTIKGQPVKREQGEKMRNSRWQDKNGVRGKGGQKS